MSPYMSTFEYTPEVWSELIAKASVSCQ